MNFHTFSRFEFALLLVPFLMQAAAMFFDEFYFHRRRGLPTWEKIGHPLDSLTVLISYAFLAIFPYSSDTLKIYIGLASFSCLFITKDEFVHTRLCDAKENWLHAVLFILHPLTFLSAGLIWMTDSWRGFLQMQVVVVFLFLLFQIIYWQIRDRGLRS